MLAAGLNVTLNTDDPSISGITLSDEFKLAYNLLGISLNNLVNITLAGARSSFLSPVEKEDLLQSLKMDFQSFE